jgi:hypothetical protein
MSSLLVDWLYRTGMLTERNRPTPPVGPVHASPAIGSTLPANGLFDDRFWLNATGANCVVDQIDLTGSAERVLSVAVLYGDGRAAVGTSDTFYRALHGSSSSSSSSSAIGRFRVRSSVSSLPTSSLTIRRGVRVARVRICGDRTGVRYLSVALSDGHAAAAGDNTTAAVCTTYAPPTPNATVVGVYGSVGTHGLTALGLWWY